MVASAAAAWLYVVQQTSVAGVQGCSLVAACRCRSLCVVCGHDVSSGWGSQWGNRECCMGLALLGTVKLTSQLQALVVLF